MADRRDLADEESPLDDLRLRLYRADATDEDVQRYLAEQDAAEPRVSSSRPRRSRAAVIAIVLTAAAALVTGVLLHHPAEQVAAPFDSASGRAEEVLSASGDVQGPTPQQVAVEETSVVGQRFRGVGRAAVDVAAPQNALDGGRVLIVMTTSGSTRVGWTATSLVSQADWTTFHDEIASGAAWAPFGAAGPGWTAYPAQPPTRIEVDAPDGVGWTLVVAFSAEDGPVRR